MSKILRLVKNTAASFASLLVQLFQMVLLKLGYEYKGTFLVIFLGLQTECVYWAFFFLLDFIFDTMVFFFYSLLAGSCFSQFLLLPHLCYTFHPFLSFESIKIALHEILMLILLESCRE